ncbi:hypothetical protein RN347_15470 [Halomonas sp. PAMB 3264]|uniref:hypothetical protein n=1 Tax=Halomonas sp. PAMB 3264 TaxID=3075222 RepID=UPI0028963106|nr:hypothetical protein [Halomonas sp. PAMB 3264]WNL42005.1 hypothetical protein RN347_15470 [Halomonas sp. PAMB 3264]
MRLGTLGPESSNHALIAKRYLTRRASGTGEGVYFEDFERAFEALLAGDISHLLQCTAHSSHADCVGRTMHRAFPVDVFIAGSHPLALIVRRDVQRPSRLALQPATRHYTDLSAFDEIVELPTTSAVADALLAGEVDAGLCAAQVVSQAPQTLRIERALGSALDTWVIYSTTQAPPSSPLRLDEEDGGQAP